ncbi:recombination protein NinG [Brucepastera parasyntrophica]|uniref:recombination protein NinG n=1 Tax=Brucepastera parasyntrophica TaxID=2880008 RepID=UPI00210A57F6|nr:recombination protein NinG [Brucepastera parasyntrophica]ULQ59220.1 recombination protein NinG [Brucepastera parasyntrophica]
MSYRFRKAKSPTGPKATAGKWFSKFIRIRDALKTTGTRTHARCITCGKVHHVSAMHAGHAIPGRTAGILFDEQLVYAQCPRCNCGGDGEKQAFKRVLVEKYGIEWWEMKEQQKRKAVILTDFDYRELSRVYRNKLKELGGWYEKD